MSRHLRYTTILCCVLAAGPGRAVAADWEWTLAPYLWGSDIGLDVTANNDPVAGGDLAFSDLVDKLEMAALLHFEGRHGRGGFFLDATYLEVSDESTTPPRTLLPGGAQIASDITTGFYEAGGFYRPGGEQLGFDVLGGVRFIDFDQEHDVTPPAPTPVPRHTLASSGTLIDGFIGARYGVPFGKRWDFVIRVDVGAGGTEFTWNALGTVGLRIGETGRYSARLGWRQMELEIEDEGLNAATIETEMELSGPIAAFVFRF